MNKHVRSIHTFSICKDQFATNLEVLQHVEKAHGSALFHCKICNNILHRDQRKIFISKFVRIYCIDSRGKFPFINLQKIHCIKWGGKIS